MLDRWRIEDQTLYIEIIKNDLLQARNKQAHKLARFVRNGHLSLDQICAAAGHQLQEICKRFSVTADTGELFCETSLVPSQAKNKFARVMGLIPPENQDIIDTDKIRNILTEIIEDSNRLLRSGTSNGGAYPQAEILAVVCGGSRFEQGKTPDADSDFDMNVLLAEEGYVDLCAIRLQFEQKIQRTVDIGSSILDKYVKSASTLIRKENEIAEPFRCKHIIPGMKFIPFLNPRSLIVAAPEYLETLQALATRMPPLFSDQPFGDIYYRPTETQFSALDLHTSSGWYADAVEKLLASK